MLPFDRLSKKLREKIGESLRTIRANEPLEAVTTASLQALQKYSLAVHVMDSQNDYERGIALLEESIAEDSSFAMAWRKLGVGFSITRVGRDRLVRAANRAYELRDRLTERERYHAIAFYELNVTGDERRAITAYRSLLEAYPTDVVALNNLAAAYNWIADYDRAAEYYGRAVAADSFSAVAYANHAILLYRLGQRDEAKAVLDVHRRRFREVADTLLWLLSFVQAEGEWDRAEELARQLRQQSRESAFRRSYAEARLARLPRLRGRLDESRRHRLELAQINTQRGVPGAALRAELEFIDEHQWFRQRPDVAQRQLDELLARTDLNALPITDRPHLMIAEIYARSGRADRARAFIAEREAIPEMLRGDERAAIPYAKGWVALAEDRAADAVAEFRSALESDPCGFCPILPLAVAFEAAAQTDSAIAYYRRYTDSPDMERAQDESWHLSVAYEHLAELYAKSGDTDNAAAAAARFVQLWDRADADLQPRVQAKRDLLRRLRRT